MVKPRQLKLLVVLEQKLTVNLSFLLNSLLHDTSDRIRWARHSETVVSHHGLSRLIVSHNLVQQNLTWDGLIAPLEISQDLVVQNSIAFEIGQQTQDSVTLEISQ